MKQASDPALSCVSQGFGRTGKQLCLSCSMLVSLKALEKSFTSEIRRMLYLWQNMKVPRPSGKNSGTSERL